MMQSRKNGFNVLGLLLCLVIIAGITIICIRTFTKVPVVTTSESSIRNQIDMQVQDVEGIQQEGSELQKAIMSTEE